MKVVPLIFNFTWILMMVWATGCASISKTPAIHGQIVVADAGKIQETGRAPVWIYDAANVQLTTKIPLPGFGGRSRDDWKRIVTAYPDALSVYSNYEALVALPPAAEVKRIAKAREYYEKKAALNGQTNGSNYEAVKKLGTEWKALMAEEDRLWDQEDDMGELIVFWYNVNPGILYAAGLPEPLLTTQTDQSGRFSFTIPLDKPVLIATHINGTAGSQAGNYFWLVPLDPAHAGTNGIILNGENVRCNRKQSNMPQVILPETNGYLGSAVFGPLHRLRDERMDATFELP
jgi:hypothetical protein